MIIELADGRCENVSCERDVIDLIREYCGEDLAGIMERAKCETALKFCSNAADDLYEIVDIVDDRSYAEIDIDRLRVRIKKLSQQTGMKETAEEMEDCLDRIEGEIDARYDEIEEIGNRQLRVFQAENFLDSFI